MTITNALNRWLQEVESGNEPGLNMYETDKKIIRAMVELAQAVQAETPLPAKDEEIPMCSCVKCLPRNRVKFALISLYSELTGKTKKMDTK